MRWIKRILLILAVCAAAFLIYYFFYKPTPPMEYHTDVSRLKRITQMVDLSSLEFHEEIPVKDNIDGKWIVARMTIEGSVKFDMDSIRFRESGDTTFVTLPKEKIEIYESTDPRSYEVIDTWDADRVVFGRKLTAAEENSIKQRARESIEARIRKQGYVERARKNAIETLTPLFNAMHGPYGKQGPIVIE